jgi:uncharacterized secreted protein with C-terminal beta-propeller domain
MLAAKAKNKNWLKVLAVLLVSVIATSTVAYALLTWNHTYIITMSNKNFIVYKDKTMTQIWDSGLSTAFVDPNVITGNYYINNVGDVPILVTGVVTFTSGGATVSWTPSSSQQISKSGDATFTLTLSNFVGSSSVLVTFTSTAVS